MADNKKPGDFTRWRGAFKPFSPYGDGETMATIIPRTTLEFAKLIKKCAFEMNAEDRRVIDEKHEAGEEWLGQSVCGPSGRGHEICIETANGMGMKDWADPVYYLLAYTWNDILDWADKVGAG